MILFKKREVELLKDEKQLECNMGFFLTKNRTVRVQNNDVFRAILQCSKVPGDYLEVKEGIHWKEGKKIPIVLFYQIVEFFRSYDSEVYAQIFWSRTENKYYVFVPEQIVTGASVECRNDFVREQTDLLVVEIHSHNKMGAFFSGTDDKDEKRLAIYGVLSFRQGVESKFRLKCGDDQYDLQVRDIFDIEYPKEWKDKVSTPKYESSKNWEGSVLGQRDFLEESDIPAGSENQGHFGSLCKEMNEEQKKPWWRAK